MKIPPAIADGYLFSGTDSKRSGSIVAAAAVMPEDRTQRAVFSQAICSCEKKRPSAACKCARREEIRPQKKQDNENPKAAVAL